MHLKDKHYDKIEEWKKMQPSKKPEPEVVEEPEPQRSVKAIGSLQSEIEADLQHRFGYHRPGGEVVVQAHETVRDQCLHTALLVVQLCPDGRERALAVTKLEEAMMWANAAIARHHPDNFKQQTHDPDGT